MKKIIYLLLIFITAEVQGAPAKENAEFIKNIEGKVKNAFVKSCIDNNVKSLEEVEIRLALQKSNNIIIYWKAYTYYYKSIFYIVLNKMDKSKLEVEKGLLQFESIKNKTSEDYALMALMQSFAIQFSSGVRANFLFTNCKKNALKAAEMDKKNLRAYYVLGAIDFYLPKQYGGGTETELYLKKALSMKPQEIENVYLPGWGLEEAYDLLIQHYIKTKNLKLAKQYYKEALTKFPESSVIMQQSKYLID